MENFSGKSVIDYIYKNRFPFNGKEFEYLRRETQEYLMTPLKVMALLIAVSGLFAMIFEVRYFSEFSIEVYLTRLSATLAAFIILVFLYTPVGMKKPVLLVHLLLVTIIVSSGYMIYLMPSTLVVNAQIVGLMIFTSALFLSWEVKNQIIVAIYYNMVFASAILLNDKSIYFLPNMYESVIFVLFLSIISVIGSAVNFRLRLKVAEKSYRVEQSERKFRSIFNNSYEGIFQSTPEGKFITVNPTLVKILGYSSKEELLGVNIETDLYKYADQREKLLDELHKKGSVQNYQITLKKKDGRDVIVRLNDRLITDSEDKAVYFEGNVHDITSEVYAEHKRRKAEKELREEKEKSDRLAHEAMQSSYVKSQFLANMSHEIRTPINAIVGFLTLIETEAYKSSDELKQFANTAKTSAEALLDIINDILDLSKIESGKMELEEVEFDLNEIINESVSILSAKAYEKGLEISKEISEHTPVYLVGDSTRVRQVLVNLISNAVKFTGKGKVKISVKPKEVESDVANLLFVVADTGIGIPENKMKELFQPFSQVDGSHTRKYGGTGLGLVICRQFVNMMGGEIDVESVPGKGSKFYFNIKLKVQSKERQLASDDLKMTYSLQAANNNAASDDIKIIRGGYNILLTEDNLINQKVALRILTEAGFNAEAVNNGIEAIKALNEKDYSLILMDVQMPEMDGFTATKEIRKLEAGEKHIPIIAITAHALSGDRDKCLQAGMDDYVSKPIIADKMIKVIDKWLDINSSPKAEVKPLSVQPPEINIFDFDHLNKMSMGDKEFEKELISTYFEDVKARIKNLEDHLTEKNKEKIISEAHTIKGASYSVGAKKVGDVAMFIEQSSKGDEVENLKGHLISLKHSLEKTKEALKDLIQPLS